MQKILFPVLFASISSILNVHIARAQAMWTQSDLYPPNSALYAVIGFPNGLAVCVGENGVIQRSTDTGNTWAVQTVDNLTLIGIASYDARHFLAVSREGKIILSSDSGISWQLWDAQSNDTADGLWPLYAIAAVDDTSFIAVGPAGTIVSTYNFGPPWNLSSAANGYNLNSVTAINGPHIILIACGDSGTIQLSENPASSGDPGLNNWATVSSGSTANLRHLTVTPDGRVFAYGDDWAVLMSADSGESWQHVTIDSTTSNQYPGATVRNIVFFSPTHGFAFVAQDQQPTLLNDYVTQDGGLTWQALNIEDLDDDDYAAVAIDTMRGIKVGQDGGIYLTSNQGHSWKEVNNQISPNYTHLAFSSASNGFVARRSATNEIDRTTDAGADWSKVFVPPSGVEGMLFPNVAIGYAYGNGFFSRTVDSGATWNTIATAVGNAIWASFSSPAIGLLLASSGSLLSTSDSGRSWMAQNGPPGNPTGLVSVSLFGEDTIIVLGSNKVFQSRDGGLVWDSVEFPYRGKSMRFSDQAHGWIVGSGVGPESRVGSVIFFSSDVGETWIPQLLDTSNATEGLSDIAIADDSHAIATDYFSLGHKPPIFETSDGGVTWVLDTMRGISSPQNTTGAQNFCGIAYPSSNSAYMLTEAGDLFSGIFATSGVRIQSESLFPSISLYPNPCEGGAVTVLFPPHNGALELSVWDESGKLRLQLPRVLEDQATIPSGSLPEGSYYLNVTGDNFSKSIPFIREK